MSDPSKKIAGEIDRFDDIFHTYADDIDEKEDMNINIDFDQFFTDFHDDNETSEVASIDPVQVNANTIIDLTTDEEGEQQEQQRRLSQKFSQLLPSNEINEAKDVSKDVDDLPYSKKTFEEIINPLLPNTATSLVIMEELRQIVQLENKLQLINCNTSLYTTYLHSGTGELYDDEQEQSLQRVLKRPNLSIWPKELKTTMLADTKANIKEHEINHDTYLKYVKKMLRELRGESAYYQTQLKRIKERLNNSFTLEIEETIKKFIEEYEITLDRIRIETRNTIVKYDYIDRLLEMEFYRENPYEEQIETFKNLCKLKFDKEVEKMNVALLKQRTFHQYLPHTINSIQIPLEIPLNSIADDRIRVRLTAEYEKVMQRTKSDMMAIYIRIAEAKMEGSEDKFETNWTQFNQLQRTGATDLKLTEAMYYIMKRRFKNIDKRLEILYRLKVDFFAQAPVVVNNENVNHRSNSNRVNLGCSPCIIQHATHHLSFEQLKFLHRGPTYVSPCQIHILSKSVPINEILMKKIAPLQQQLRKLFTTYPIHPVNRYELEKAIEKEFIQSFSIPIPSTVEQRVLHEKQIIQSIRNQLKTNKLILRRTADTYNTYYLGHVDAFNQMANNYIENANYLETIGFIDECHSEEQHLTKIITSINFDLKELQEKHIISIDYFNKLQIDKNSNIKLPYLYFLPKTHDTSDVTVQPKFSLYEHCPLQKLANFLEQLLRPLFEKYSQSTTFLNGADFIRKLQYYCLQKDSVLQERSFITYQVHNLYTRISHVDILTALNRFLIHAAVDGHIQGLTIDAIQELTRLVLHNNIFTYNGKVYRFIKGSPLNLVLTRLLGNIYLQNWHRPFVKEVLANHEFYGRYHDIGIMTWNKAVGMDRFPTIINELNEQHPDIQLTISVGSSVHFLNAYIENQNGSLYTRVYHDPMIQRFLLPYIPHHPRLGHRQWFHFALIRAGLYCLLFEDFQDERLRIELTFLVNGYSLDSVQYHFQQFLNRFNPSSDQHQPFQLNRSTYTSFRMQLFGHFHQQKRNAHERQELEDTHKLIQLFYLFDWGSRCEFNEKFSQFWSTIVNEDATFKSYEFKVILNTKHCYSSNTLLAQYKSKL